MAQTIQIKRSTSTATPSSLAAGELAYSGKSDSNKLFIGHPDGSTGPVAIGGVYYTGIIDGAASANTASKLVKRDGSGNFSAGTITAALTGNVTGNADTATALANGRTIAITGDLGYTSPSFDGSGNVTAQGTLATVNSNVGQAGSATAVPVITVNAKGLVTAVSTASISTSYNLAADSGTTNAVAGGETLTIAGGTGVDTVVSGNTVTASIGQAVGTSATPTFGNITTTGYLAGPATFTIDPAAVGDNTGTVVIAGNLTVNGTQTTVNSNTVNIGDAIMTLNSDEAGTPSANAGIEIERGTATNVSLLWNEGSDYFQINDGSTTSKILTAGNFASSFTGTLDGGTF
jgi:hypothetical protein